ncbi:Protein of unknown function, partial [Gryllus bimaculatus]
RLVASRPRCPPAPAPTASWSCEPPRTRVGARRAEAGGGTPPPWAMTAPPSAAPGAASAHTRPFNVEMPAAEGVLPAGMLRAVPAFGSASAAPGSPGAAARAGARLLEQLVPLIFFSSTHFIACELPCCVIVIFTSV